MGRKIKVDVGARWGVSAIWFAVTFPRRPSYKLVSQIEDGLYAKIGEKLAFITYPVDTKKDSETIGGRTLHLCIDEVDTTIPFETNVRNFLPLLSEALGVPLEDIDLNSLSIFESEKEA